MARSDPEVQVVDDLARDQFIVRLRVWDTDRHGKRTKRGIMIAVREEQLRSVPEGCEYPRRNLER